MRILPAITQEAVEQASFAHCSDQAVRNMYDAAVVRLERLKLHQARLECWVATENDLYELLKCGERLQRVDRNMSRLHARIRELRGELFKRRLREMA